MDYKYIWGNLLTNKFFNDVNLKIINLETSVTTSKNPQNKAVLYKMHPYNIQTLKVVGIDYCNLSNNHLLDWGHSGLKETLETLKSKRIGHGGAGYNIHEAQLPQKYNIFEQSVYIYSVADFDSGIPSNWKASDTRLGINVININDWNDIDNFGNFIKKTSSSADLVIVSVHWGSNWGWEVEQKYEDCAHYLIDHCNVDLIHGHSSHHFRPIEIYKNKLIIYGCGDLINDYEIIHNPLHDQFMPHVCLTYYPLYQNRQLISLKIIPLTIKNFQLIELSIDDQMKSLTLLNSICEKYGLIFNTSY